MPTKRGAKRQTLHIDIVKMDGDWSNLPDGEEAIRAAAAAVEDLLRGDARTGMIVIALSNDAHVAGLNKQFRHKSKPTNVLSFPSSPENGDHIGDIVMAYETVVREAEDQGLSLKDHVQHLTVHGILHLFGYDHDCEKTAERMEALEIKILSSLGVANPYTSPLEPATKE